MYFEADWRKNAKYRWVLGINLKPFFSVYGQPLKISDLVSEGQKYRKIFER
jgi:hypothetical protein